MTYEAELRPLPPALLRVGRYIIYALLILFPLVVLHPKSLFYNPLDAPRRLIIFFATGILVALIVYAWALRGRITLRWQVIDLPVTLFWLAGILCSLLAAFGSYARVSLFGPIWSQDGLMLFGTGILLYFGIKEFLRERGEIELAAAIMVTTGALVAIIGYIDHFCHVPIALFGLHIFPINPAFSGLRLESTQGNSMYTGTYLAMLIPLGWGIALATAQPARRWAMVVCSCIMLPALLLTMARAAWVGFGLACILQVAMLGFLLFRDTLAISRKYLFIALGLIILVIAGAFVWGVSQPTIRERLQSMIAMRDGTIQTRKLYTIGAMNAFCARPISGWGLGNVKNIFPQFRPKSDQTELNLPINRDFATAQPHNLPVQVAAEMGLLGLIPFLMLIFALYRTGFRLLSGDDWQAWMAFGLIGILSAYLFSNLAAFDNATTMANFWCGLALLAAIPAKERPLPEKYGRLARPFREEAAALITLAAMLIAIGTLISTSMQTGAAYLTEHGSRLTENAGAYVVSDPNRCRAQIDRGVAEIRQAITLTPFGDTVPYLSLMLAYQRRCLLANTTDELIDFQDKLYDTGKKGLTVMEREPRIARTLIMQYRKFGRTDDARPLAEKLVRFEPNSSGAHLLRADIFDLDKDCFSALDEARIAVALDPTFGDAVSRLAHFEMESILKAPVVDPRKLSVVLTDYDKAAKLGGVMQGPQLLDISVAHFMMGDREGSIKAARPLVVADDRDNLMKLDKIICAAYGKAGKMNEFISYWTELIKPASGNHPAKK